MSLAVRRAAQ